MKISEDTIIKPFIAENEERPWGYYGLYSDNRKCTSKILFIKRNEMLSLQYHFKRDQFYMLLDDDFIIQYSNKPVPNKLINEKNEDWRVSGFEKFLDKNMITIKADEGAMFGFKKKIIHRAIYKGDREYGRILDLAFGINDETDIVRIKDKYGRS